MAYGTSSANQGAASPPSVAVPASVAAGDIIILAMSIDNTVAAPTAPSGFTQLDTQTLTLDGQRCVILWKRATGADTGSYTWGASQNVGWAAVAIRLTGRDGSNPPVNSTFAASNTANTSPITATATGVTALAGDDLVYVAMADPTGTVSGSGTAPTSFTLRQSEKNTAGDSYVLGCTEDNVGAGATGSIAGQFTMTSGGSGWGAWVIRVPSGGVADLTVSVSDSTSTTESVAAAISSPAVSVSDSTSTSETVAVALVAGSTRTINVSDSVSTTETVAAAESTKTISVSDSVSTTESKTVSPPSSTPQANVSDSVATSEFVVIAFDPPITFTLEVDVTDSVTTAESVSASMSNLAISANDTISTNETVGRTLTSLVAVTDSTHATESVTVTRQATGGLSINVTDSVSVSETKTASIPTALKVAVSDSTAITEGRSVSFGFVPNIDLPTSFKINPVGATLAIKSDPASLAIRADSVTGSINPNTVAFKINPAATELELNPEATGHAIDGDTT